MNQLYKNKIVTIQFSVLRIVSKIQIPSLSASAERSQISQHNGTNNVNYVQQSETINKKY